MFLFPFAVLSAKKKKKCVDASGEASSCSEFHSKEKDNDTVIEKCFWMAELWWEKRQPWTSFFPSAYFGFILKDYKSTNPL